MVYHLRLQAVTLCAVPAACSGQDVRMVIRSRPESKLGAIRRPPIVRQVYVYTAPSLASYPHETARRHNHWLDCLAGCAVAASMLGIGKPGEQSPRRARKRYTQADFRRSQ